MSTPRELIARWQRGEAELAPITGLLGVRFVSLGDGEAVVSMEADARHHNALGTVHGGVFCDVADVAMGLALATTLGEREAFTTLSLQSSFLRAVRQSRLEARARVVRRGRTSAFVECEVLDDQGQLAAKVSSTCLIQPPG